MLHFFLSKTLSNTLCFLNLQKFTNYKKKLLNPSTISIAYTKKGNKINLKYKLSK